MSNKDFSALLNRVADILEIEEVEWKPRAYRNAARAIDNLDREIEDIYKEGGLKSLKEIEGIGESIAEHIEEYINKGKVEKFEKLLRKYSPAFVELMYVSGLGAKKIKALREELGIRSMEDLKRAAEEHKISKLRNFGEKTEKNILEALKFKEVSKGRMLLSEALPVAEDIVRYMGKNSPVQEISYVGSLRRMKETIGDIDILAAGKDAKKIMGVFTSMDKIRKVVSKGTTKSTILLKENIQVDLRIVPKESYPAALQYFTGSKDHNIETRRIAIRKGYKLSEYGLFDKHDKKIPIENEEELYRKLGLSYIPPELRENRGEIEVAKKGNLPKLIELNNIKGDFHIHTLYSDGVNTVEDMAKSAQERGYEYIAITDHSPSSRIAHGLSVERLEKQWKEIDRISKKYKIKILKGSEVDILEDGSLDYSDKILRKLNIVIGSVHSNFKLSKEKMTERLIRAVENESLDIIGHLTGRLINRRGEYSLDFERVFEAVAKNNKVIEINSQPDRLDIYDNLIIAARERGVKFCIDTDSHSIGNLNFMRYGIGQARRGWLAKEDVVNTYSYKALRKIFRKIP